MKRSAPGKAALALLAAFLCSGASPAEELAAIKALVREEPQANAFVREGGYRNGAYVLMTCDVGPATVPEWSFNPSLAAKLVLGTRSLVYADALTKLGYPEATRDALIARYERAGLGAIRSNPTRIFSGSLERDINKGANAYQRTHRGLAPIDFGDNKCGGSPPLAKATFILRPRGTRAFVIPAFFGKVCRSKGVDSFDLNRCDGWIEVLDGSSLGVYGRYLYQVMLNGKVQRGTLVLETTQAVRLTG